MNLIKPFDPWQAELCTCPPKYSLSPYTGCNHGCLYCYASSYIRNFTQVREKKDFRLRLAKEIKKIPAGAHITIANSSDPYLPLEAKLKLTQGMLEILKNYELNILLVTKSHLILRDLDLLKRIKRIVVAFTLTTLDQALAKKLEPAASLPKERLKAITILAQHLPVAVRVDPLIYPINTENMEPLLKTLKASGVKQIITSTYKAKPDNLKRMGNAFAQHKSLWQKLYLEEGERKGSYIYLAENLRRKLIGKVKKLTQAQGMEFSSCREGLAVLNSKPCDASYFLSCRH